MTDPKDFYAWPRPTLTHQQLLAMIGSDEGRYCIELELVTSIKRYLRANPQVQGAYPTRNDLFLRGGQDILRVMDFLANDRLSPGRDHNLNIYYRSFNSACMQLTEEEANSD